MESAEVAEEMSGIDRVVLCPVPQHLLTNPEQSTPVVQLYTVDGGEPAPYPSANCES